MDNNLATTAWVTRVLYGRIKLVRLHCCDGLVKHGLQRLGSPNRDNDRRAKTRVAERQARLVIRSAKPMNALKETGLKIGDRVGGPRTVRFQNRSNLLRSVSLDIASAHS
jgi:hypothetical protein